METLTRERVTLRKGVAVIYIEKAAGVLPTPTTASKLLNTRSVSAAAKVCNISAKAYTTLQAEFALLGRELVRVHRRP